MSVIYLLLAVCGITTVSYLAKLSAKKGVSSLDLTWVMFAAASVLGYFFVKFNSVEQSSYTPELLAVSAMAGLGGATAVLFSTSPCGWVISATPTQFTVRRF